MSPTVETPQERWYHFRLKDGSMIVVRASILCRPDDASKKYQLKREGEIVGEFEADAVDGWWLSDKPSPILNP